VVDYIAQYNAVETKMKDYFAKHQNTKIPLYANLACFLGSSGESELMKFDIFKAVLLKMEKVTLM
jgi:hypothetical protein